MIQSQDLFNVSLLTYEITRHSKNPLISRASDNLATRERTLTLTLNCFQRNITRAVNPMLFIHIDISYILYTIEYNVTPIKNIFRTKLYISESSVPISNPYNGRTKSYNLSRFKLLVFN